MKDLYVDTFTSMGFEGDGKGGYINSQGTSLNTVVLKNIFMDCLGF